MPIAETVPSAANDALVAAFGEHLATRPARTREAYVRDVQALARLAGALPIADLDRAMVSRNASMPSGEGGTPLPRRRLM